MKDIIILKDIKKSFSVDKNNKKSELVLNHINLNFQEGGFYSIIGRSGCGKSTLLRLINGLETADQGEVWVDGETIHASTEKSIRQKVGMVFQSFQLFDHLNLLENITKPLTIVKKMDSKTAHKMALDYLERVGLTDHQFKFPYQLSGGQQQRGAIARALALKPKIMLYDEPTSALDPELAQEVRQVMKSIDHSITQILVTHDMRLARDISDQVIYMHQGRIEEIAPADTMFTEPKSNLTKDFLKTFF